MTFSIFSCVYWPFVYLLQRIVHSGFLLTFSLHCFIDIELHKLVVYFKTKSLSIALFTIIFSHSESCLFILFIVSFAVQKLLSFIRSHLFIFVFISITLGGGQYDF